MKNANAGLWISAMIVCLGLAFACKEKPTPGPDPTPTAVVIPTEVPGADAVCHSPAGPGNPPYCEDAVGDVVTCPESPENLPKCPE